ncbi:hypothetical protein RND81_10G246600 [Saponaria officinalis]|uniref:RING-type domain-containing protein n=1 Tax=Saponaria officinalis TaxID=3572 RepID=A0AAW1I853_SAPOF
MGQQNSKDEMLYHQVIEANVDNIKALFTQGARLEWIDKEGKTPLILASMDPRLYIVAKTLIGLGANINAYRPGRHAGTPLHHAAKRGLDDTVKLLLSHGANPFTRNDDCQTPLDVARVKGHCNVVRAIEAHISCFSGDMSEIMVVPGILEPFVPQRLSRKRSKKCWVVVVPCSLANPQKPPKLELAVYNNSQDPHPRTVIALWKCHIAEPKFHEPDPTLVIVDKSNGTRYKFMSAIEGNRRQFTQLYSACKGFPVESQGEASPLSNDSIVNDMRGRIRPAVSPGADSKSNPAVDVTNGWGDISTSATHNEPGSTSRPPTSKASDSGWADQPAPGEFNGWGAPRPDIGTTQDIDRPPLVCSAPSAPPLPADIIDMGPIHYPVVDSGPVDLAGVPNTGNNGNGESGEACCVICWDAPVEGACIPCGHMAGCMSCLTEIRAKKGNCPVCRANIDQVIRLYSV